MTTKISLHCVWVLVFSGLAIGCAKSTESPAVASKATTSAPAAGAQKLDITFENDPNPPRAGDNTVEVIVKQADGTPVKDAAVSAVFYMPAMPSMSMPEMRSTFTLAPVGDGRYRGKGELVMSGTWNVTVNVTRNGEKLDSRKFTVIAK